MMNQDEKLARYKDFLERHLDRIEATSKIQDMMSQNKMRFPINLDNLRKESKDILPNLVDDLIKNPTELLKVLQTKLQSICEQLSDATDDGGKKAGKLETDYKIYFEGKFGKNFVTPRGLGAHQVNQLVAIQGIVTKLSLVQLKMKQSVHFIEKTYKFKTVDYSDNMDPSELTKSRQATNVQKKDEEGNPMTLEFGESTMKNYQTFIVQEVPERTPTGMLPRQLEIILSDDAVDSIKPGDRVTVSGIYKCQANSGTFNNGVFRTILIALDVKPMIRDMESKITQQDILNIEEIAGKQRNILEWMSKSIAPSIYGHEMIKQAVLLLLLGGTEKNLKTGTHLRGDINLLLIGDPSTAKSQMLRYIMGVAPLAINTTGRGTSSVGLTAAVKKDPDTGENTLEAGAMVLADGGVILIDEFDKMNEIDRVGIHEAMEQQTVSIAKAGIQCQLNARCSVVAAANPIFGEYQLDILPTVNIGLPDSLLSRFDLLFIVLDEKNKQIDRKVSDRVTKNHRYKEDSYSEQAIGDIIQPMTHLTIKQETPYMQYQKTLHTDEQKDLLNQTFLKKYIQYAKETISETILDDEAREEVTNQWVDLRARQSMQQEIRTLPITIRSLESLIRLASAHAKLRLSRTITKADVIIAAKLMKFSLQMEDIEIQEQPIVEKGNKRSNQKGSRNKEKIEQSASILKIEQEQPQKIEESQVIVKQSDKKKKQKKDEKELDADAEFHMDLQAASSLKVTKDQQKTVFKMIKEMGDLLKQDEVLIDLVWGRLQSQARPMITEYPVFLKCLLDLEEKVVFDLTKKTVQLV